VLEADPLVCWNCLAVIAMVGAQDVLIVWARALPDPPARASALVTIALGGVVR
jgi:hypothetical protein